MNGLNVFERYKAAGEKIARKREQIERRRALAEGCTSRPLTPDSGTPGSGDASMRLVDYMADVEKLEGELKQMEAQRVRDKACCVYLAENLPEQYGELLMRRYIDGETVQDCAAAMSYSVRHFRRIQKEAEEMCARIEIVAWDGSHIPIITILNKKA